MEFTIDSREKWNHTGFTLEAGAVYRLSAKGQWTDWYIEYGPDGGESGSNIFLKLFEKLRRRPKDNWFALIGSVDEDESRAFLIGSSNPHFTAPYGGELTCYANDVSFAYFNNHGAVELMIDKILEP